MSYQREQQGRFGGRIHREKTRHKTLTEKKTPL